MGYLNSSSDVSLREGRDRLTVVLLTSTKEARPGMQLDLWMYYTIK